MVFFWNISKHKKQAQESVGRPYLKDQELINYSELIMLVLLFSLLFESGFIDYFEVPRSCNGDNVWFCEVF